MVDTFKEGIIIEDFDSREEKLRLVSRSDFPPAPKEIKESLPFVQGEYDFSNVLGETFYENRKVKYLFYQRYNDYPRRKINKIYLQNKLLPKHNVKIYDTAKLGFYYLGKVSKVDVTDVHTKHRLEVEIELDCYPYMISELQEGHDIWDDFNFELDVAQDTTFEVNGTKEVSIYNGGSASVVPTIVTDSEFTIELDTVSISTQPGTHKSELIRLQPGYNHMMLTGNGSIRFNFYKELI